MNRWKPVWVLLFALAVLVGCSAEEEGGSGIPGFRALGPSDLAQRSFDFAPGAGIFAPDDPQFGQGATLTVGELLDSTKAAGFSLISDDGSIMGGVLTLGSCFVDPTFVQAAGEQPLIGGADPMFFYCGVDAEGRLGLLEDDESLPIVSEPGTAVTPDFDAEVSLSPEAVVDPAFTPGDRPERGTARLTLAGNVLSYTVEIENLTSGDTIKSGHIYAGGVSDNGELLFTLFGQPIQQVRATNPPQINGTRITASIFLTPDEVEALTEAGRATYLQVTSDQAMQGLLRGQIGSVSVGPDGGVVTFPNGVMLDIPAGALSETVEISVSDLPMDEVDAMIAARRIDADAQRRMVGAFRISPSIDFGKAVTVTLPVSPPESGEIWRQVDIDREAGEIWPVATELEYVAERGVVEMKLPAAASPKRLGGAAPKDASGGSDHGVDGTLWTLPEGNADAWLLERCKYPSQLQACERLDPIDPACCLLKDIPETCSCCRLKDFYAQSSATDSSRIRGMEICEILTDATIVHYYECKKPDGTPLGPESYITGALSPDCPEDTTLEIEIIRPPGDLFVCKTQEFDARIRAVQPDGTEVVPWKPFEPLWNSIPKEKAEFIPNPNSGEYDGTLKGVAEGPVAIWAESGLPRSVSGQSLSLDVLSHLEDLSIDPDEVEIEKQEGEILTVTAIERGGAVLPTTGVKWESADVDIVYVTQDVGEWTSARGWGAGCTDVEAEYEYQGCETKATTARVCVDCPMTRVSVDPERTKIVAGGFRALSVEVTQNGQPVDASGVGWESSDSHVVFVPASGAWVQAHGNYPGQAWVAATFEDECQVRQAIIEVEVCPSLDVEPRVALVGLGDSVVLELLGRDSFGNEVRADFEGAIWESDNPGVVSVVAELTELAVVRGNSVGTATITATHEGDCGEQTVNVQVDVFEDVLEGDWQVQVIWGEQVCTVDGDTSAPEIVSTSSPLTLSIEQNGPSATGRWAGYTDSAPYVGNVFASGDPSQPYALDLSVRSDATADCIEFFRTGGETLLYGHGVCPADRWNAIWSCTARQCFEDEQITGHVQASGNSFIAESTWGFSASGDATLEQYDPETDTWATTTYSDVEILCQGEASLVACRDAVPWVLVVDTPCNSPEEALLLCTDFYGPNPERAECAPVGGSEPLQLVCMYCMD